MIQNFPGLRLTPLTIALTYTLLGGIWVFFSDHLLAVLLTDTTVFQRGKIVNEWAFIVLSSQILYLLIRRCESVRRTPCAWPTVLSKFLANATR